MPVGKIGETEGLAELESQGYGKNKSLTRKEVSERSRSGYITTSNQEEDRMVLEGGCSSWGLSSEG